MKQADLISGLNEDQASAVTHKGSPLLVLAGAGSGKTRVLTYRTFWLISQAGVRPENIVLLTFTNKAASEMKERVRRLLQTDATGGDGNIGFAGTFHTFCARLLRRYGRSLGIEPGFVIYDSSDQEMAVKGAIKKLGLDPKKIRPRGAMAVISKFKNELVGVEMAEAGAKQYLFKEVIGVWREYEKILTKNRGLDFDDLLVKTVDLLRLPDIRGLVQEQFRHVLIDEYQDTNKAQFELTKLLIPTPESLTVVGDASQAIYSFRGADFRNLELLRSQFENLTVVQLETNYRSTQNILDAAYGIINNNTNHPILKLKTNEQAGEQISLFEAFDERDEAGYVVREIQKSLKDGGSSAILYRTNAQSRTFEEELLRRGIPYRLVGGTRFYDRLEIKDLTAYLRVISNPEDDISWQRIEKNGKRKKQKFEEWLGVNREELANLLPIEILQMVISETKYLEQFDEKNLEDLSRIENIKEFMAVAGEQKTLVDLLENISLIQADEIADRNKEETINITLMTIHAAKGLEFDRVFVVGLEEGLFPHSRSLLSKDDMEEERRLLYVAITRAKTKLDLTYARNRLVYGGRIANLPSRFLAEIPEELLFKHNSSKYSAENSEGCESVKNRFRRGKIEDIESEDRRIVQDWEVEAKPVSKEVVRKLVQDDFEEIDSW